MKKFILVILVALLSCTNVYSQTKNVRTKRTSTSVTAKQKAEAKAKEEAEAAAKAEAEAAAKAEAAAAERARLENNKKCSFSFSTGEFISNQGRDGFVIYEIPEMTASELKSAVYTTLSSMFKSPKDAITSISDDIIQLEGFSPSLYTERLTYSYSEVYNHFIFNLIIQFKDGKVRYNTPSLRYIHMQVEGDDDIQSTSNISGVNMKKYFEGSEKIDYKLNSIERYFNNLISSINSKLKASNDW